MHKTIFTWFDNLPTSTELQGFHYKIRRYNSAQEHSQEIQFPITLALSHIKNKNRSWLPLSSLFSLMRLLTRLIGISLYFHSTQLQLKYNIYIYIYIKVGWIRFPITNRIRSKQSEFRLDLGLWQFKPHTGPIQQYTYFLRMSTLYSKVCIIVCNNHYSSQISPMHYKFAYSILRKQYI